MTVAELIEELKAYPQNIPVCYDIYSEAALLCASQVRLKMAQPARGDGWVHDERPDKPSVMYLSLPGN